MPAPQILIFGKLTPHAKLKNPRTILSGTKSNLNREREERRRKNVKGMPFTRTNKDLNYYWQIVPIKNI
jgi:hypothetical protein